MGIYDYENMKAHKIKYKNGRESNLLERTKENVKVILRFSFIEKLKILFSRNTCVYVDLSNDMKLIGNTIYSESRIINNVDYL